jgi:hypothetical protein
MPKTTHGMFGTPIYRVWSEMVQRCTNPNNQHWSHYGGRGINVCDDWRDFVNFYRDMGDRPAPGHSIDRIDNDGNYEPSNCRWATKSVQNLNRRKKPGCSSQHRGVTWFASRNKWRATIEIDGKQRHLGYFVSEDEAGIAAELARRGLK